MLLHHDLSTYVAVLNILFNNQDIFTSSLIDVIYLIIN